MKEPKPKKEAKQDEITPKKGRGRPLGSKSKNKTPKPAVDEHKPKKKSTKSGDGDEEAEAEGKNQIEEANKEDNDEEPADEPSQESVEEEDEAPVTHSLSKEEIKAKIASRKTPSKKKLTTDDSDAKSKSGGAKKQAATAGKTSSGGAKTASSTDEIDTKRKKEIELVVPRKSVKSADIREMTKEAAKKKLDGGGQQKEKKDKGEYIVGDLGAFANKLTRLNANESSKNNDEVIQMLNLLFEEKRMFRSDVERSGLAAIIAVLRKCSNPTVAQTASALRKHLMKIIRMDTGNDGSTKPLKAADDNSKAAVKKQIDNKADVGGDKKDVSKKEQNDKNGVTKSQSVVVEAAKPAAAVPSTDDKPAKDVKLSDEKSLTTPADSKATTALVADVVKEVPPSMAEDGNSKSAPKPVEPTAEPAKSDSDEKKTDASLDKNRQAFVDMLSNVLELSGPRHLALAKEIEVRLTIDQCFDSDALILTIYCFL